jgi:DNA-binding GntR family transcriptional regulator
MRGIGKVPDSGRGSRSSAEDGQVAGVYLRLRELIVRGQLAPGARLVERDIATRLGTSRTPVRSALQRLQQERFVAAPDSGKTARLVVAPLTSEDADELFEVVAGVEASAARRAAQLPTAQRVRVTTELAKHNAALARVTQQARPDVNEIFELDTAFHRAYVSAGAGPRLLALHDTVKPQAERYIRLYINALVDRIADSIVEHETIIEGIRSGDAELTERAVLRNWRNAAERFREVIAHIGERGTW